MCVSRHLRFPRPDWSDLKSRARHLFIVLVLLFVAPIACRQPDDEKVKERRFGDAYEILFNITSSSPDTPPVIESDTLKVHLAYSGGCKTHEFDTDYEIRSDTTFIWIHHRAHDDTCEEYVRDLIEAEIDRDALSSPNIVLLNPQSEMPIMLRWNTPTR